MIYCLRFGDPYLDGHREYVEQWISTPDIKFLEYAEKEVKKQWGEDFFKGFAHEPDDAWVADEVWEALYEADFPIDVIFNTCDLEDEGYPWSLYSDILEFRDKGSHNNLSIECVVEMYIWLMNYNGARLTKINAPFENIDRTIGYGCFEF